MLSDRTLATELAKTLVKQSSGGLSDQQVDAFLSLYDQQVPDSVKSCPQELQHLLDESKHIARDIDGYDMPSFSISVQDFRFSPPSISSAVPCTLQFRLLPHSSRQQITVLHSDSSQRVASSGVLRGGDCFNATICDPGAYTFMSEVYPFMSGTFTAAAASSVEAVVEEADAAAAAKEIMHEAASTAGGLHKLQIAGRQSPAPGSNRSHADSPRLAAKAALQQHHDQQLYQRKASPSSDTDTPGAPDASGGAATCPSTTSEPYAAAHVAVAAPATVFKCLSDPYDGLVQQPSERAMLELLSTTAAGQENVRACSSTATAATSSLADLSRAGRWARRATAYDDEADAALHTSSSSAWQPSSTELQPASKPAGKAAGEAALAQQQQAATSHISVLAGSSRSSNHSSSIGATAATTATSTAHADAATCVVAGSCMRRSCSAAFEDMDIDGDSYAAAQLQQQQQSGARGLAMLHFAKGLEGLDFAGGPLPGQPAAAATAAPPLACGSYQWTQGTAGGLLHAPAVASALAGDAAGGVLSSAAEDASDVCKRPPEDAGDDGGGWYQRLQSDSDHSSSDDGEQEDEEVSVDAQYRFSWRQSSEAASLLGEDGGVQQPQRRRLPAWGRSNHGSDDGGAPSPASSSSSEGASGDVRLRSLHGHSAAANIAALQQRKQQYKLEDGDEVLLVEDIEEYGPYEPLASCDATTAPQPMAAHSNMAASLQPRQAEGSARVGTAEAAAQTLPPLRNRAGLLQQPPGSSWSLGGTASLTVGGAVRSTFSSTNHSPLAGSDCADRGSSNGRYAVKTDNEGAYVQRNHASAAAARPTYYDRLSSSRTHVGLEASGQVVSSSSSGSTLLGPGRHVIGQQALRQQSSSNGSRTVGAGNTDDPAAQLEQLRLAHARRLLQHKLQLIEAADSDGNESPPALAVRLAQKRQLQLAAAASSLEPGSAAAAAAGAAAAKACSKKKKGRSRAAAAQVIHQCAAEEATAASRAAAAAAERRRERDHLECALYDRGSGSGSSHGDSEDEASASQPRPVGTPSTAAVAAIRAAAAAKQLTKCRFKACKLTFSTELNKHRCHMSHLPSARNATTKTYKAEVLAFLRALPTAALAQLVHLPEPASLPRRTWPDRQQQQQHYASKSGKVSGAALAAASIQRLQASPLSEAWLEGGSRAAADSGTDCGAAGLQPQLSQLARLCCGIAQGAEHAGEDDEQLPLLTRDSGPAADKLTAASPAHQQDSKPGNAAAAALATAHVASLHGACCSSCSSVQAARGAAVLMSCSCRCHPASSAAAGQAAAAHELPGFDTIIRLLEDASEGTWLCNPRLLQQQHPSGCNCSVCWGLVSTAATAAAGKGEISSRSGNKREHGVGSAALPFGAAPAAGWSPEAVMDSIGSGLDALDMLGEWGVDDASLSYVVERRMVTAFHGAKEAEARRIMSQLLEDDAPTAASAKAVVTAKISSAADSASSSQAQQQATGSSAAAAGAGCAKASKKKDKRKAGKAAKVPASTAGKKVPAWKDVSSGSDSSSDCAGTAAAGAASLPLLPASAATGSLTCLGGRDIYADRPGGPSRQQAAVFDSPSKGRHLAEQLLQARLLQQDQELSQLRQHQQQQGTKQQHAVEEKQHAKQQAQQQRNAVLQATTAQLPAKQQQPVRQAAKQQVQLHASEHRQPAAKQAQPAGDTRKPAAAAFGGVKLVARPARGSTAAAAHGSKGPAAAANSRSTIEPSEAQQQLQRPGPLHLAQQQHPVLQPSSLQPAAVRSLQQSASSTSSNSSRTRLMLPASAPAVVYRQQQQEEQQLAAVSSVEQAAVAPVEQAALQTAAAPPEAAAACAHPYSHPTEGRATPDQQGQAQSSGSSSDSPNPAPGQPAAPLPALWPVEPCESSQAQQAPNSFLPEQLNTAALLAAAGDDSSNELPQDSQEQQQWAWQQQNQQHQQHALLMHQAWLAAAQQGAVNDMLVWSGRAAAVAAGQQPPPFTAQEQQYLAQWTHFYYYQQAYAGITSAAQQQHCPQLGAQDGAADGMQQPGPSSLPQGRSTTPEVSSDCEFGEQQQQQGGSPALQLQFGSFPAEFAFSPGGDSTKGRGSPCAALLPGPAPAAAAAATAQQAVAAVAVDAGAGSVMVAVPAAVDSSRMPFQQQPQQHGLTGYTSEQYMYWWTYQQHYAAHLQQQQVANAAVALVQEGAAAELSHALTAESCGSASAGDDVVQAEHLQQQPCSQFLADMAAVVGQACAEQASGRGSIIGNAQLEGALQGDSEPCFNARGAADLLDSRWEAIIQVFGLPARQVMLPAQPTWAGPMCLASQQQQQPAGTVSPADAAADGGEECVDRHARRQHGRGRSSQAQQQQGQHGKLHTSSSTSGSSGAWRVRQRYAAAGALVGCASDGQRDL